MNFLCIKNFDIFLLYSKQELGMDFIKRIKYKKEDCKNNPPTVNINSFLLFI